MIEIAPRKRGYFDQIILNQNKASFSFSKVTLVLLWAFGNLKSAVLVTG